MNKIERAIYDVKMYIREAERQLLIKTTELKSLKEQLNTLEVIESDKSIPHLQDVKSIPHDKETTSTNNQ